MTTHHVNAVLFDLDGTLIDTAADFVRIIKEMAHQHDWQVPPEANIREQVSAGAAAMVTLLLDYNKQVTDKAIIRQYRQQFLDSYEDEICVDSRLFAGLDDYLFKLEQQGIPWGIVTNKPRYLAVKLLEVLQLDKRCSVLVCPDDVQHSKPNPEPMYLSLEKLNLPRATADKVVYVGDHIRDIEAGNAANMITILASYGYIPPEDQHDLLAWQADYIVDTPSALVDLLESDKFIYHQQ